MIPGFRCSFRPKYADGIVVAHCLGAKERERLFVVAKHADAPLELSFEGLDLEVAAVLVGLDSPENLSNGLPRVLELG